MIVDTTKKMLFATLGAPVVVARQLSDRLTEMGGKLTDDLAKEYELWAEEGEKVVAKVADRAAMEEFVEDMGARMDFDQIQEQVGKLREQLDDMLNTWRSSFRPEPGKVETAPKPAPKAAAKKAASTKPAPKKTTAAAKKPPAKSGAAKKTTAAAKKPPAKSGAAKKTTTAAKKPAAKKASTTA